MIITVEIVTATTEPRVLQWQVIDLQGEGVEFTLAEIVGQYAACDTPLRVRIKP